MKKTFALLALVAIANTAVALTPAPDVAKIGTAKPTVAPAASGGAMPANHPAALPADTKLVNSGKVLEVIDSPMYTYLQVTTDKDPLWLAAYKTAGLAKGATVKYSNGIAMPKFHSKSLNRTFDMIIFVDTVEVAK